MERRGWPRRCLEVVPEALQAPLIIPFLQLQQRVEEAASPVLADVIGGLAVGVELDPLLQAAGLQGAGNRSLVASLFLTLKAILTLSGSMKSMPLVSGMRCMSSSFMAWVTFSIAPGFPL